MNQELIKRLREKESKMIEMRRYLHEHPELSFHETEHLNTLQTSTKIKIVMLKQM